MRGPVAALLVLLLVGPAAAQEKRLSDVAAAIRLRPPSGDALFVDLAPARGTASSSGDLVELAEEYAQRLAVVSTLLAEVGVDDTFYATDWREQMMEACIDLDTVGYSLGAVGPPGRFTAALDGLVDASDQCSQATRGIREAIRLDQPQYGAAMRSLSDCRPLVSRSVEEMHRIRRAELQESPPALDDPLAAALGIAELCDARTGRADLSFDACVARQEQARRAIADRFSFSVLLDEATFNVIRNECRLEWPNDFVGRDRCEQQRIADTN